MTQSSTTSDAPCANRIPLRPGEVGGLPSMSRPRSTTSIAAPLMVMPVVLEDSADPSTCLQEIVIDFVIVTAP